MQNTWQSLAGKIDARRHREVAERLAIQVADSAKWRDQILEYFGGFSKRQVPAQPDEDRHDDGRKVGLGGWSKVQLVLLMEFEERVAPRRRLHRLINDTKPYLPASRDWSIK